MVGFDGIFHVLEALGMCADSVCWHSASSCGHHAQSYNYPIVAGGGVIIESGKIVLELAAEVIGELREHDGVYGRAAWN